jgi:hypothetical protein
MHSYTQALGLKELAEAIGCGGHRQIGHIDIHLWVPWRDETNDRQVIYTVCSNNTEEKKQRDTARGSEERSYDTE